MGALGVQISCFGGERRGGLLTEEPKIIISDAFIQTTGSRTYFVLPVSYALVSFITEKRAATFLLYSFSRCPCFLRNHLKTCFVRMFHAIQVNSPTLSVDALLTWVSTVRSY